MELQRGFFLFLLHAWKYKTGQSLHLFTHLIGSWKIILKARDCLDSLSIDWLSGISREDSCIQLPCEVGQMALLGCGLLTYHDKEEEEQVRILALKVELEMSPEWKISSPYCLWSISQNMVETSIYSFMDFVRLAGLHVNMHQQHSNF